LPTSPKQAAAQELATDMAHDLPSPYCPGRSISSCPSSSARKLEQDIYKLALEGQQREEIEQALVARFGREKMGYEQSTGVFLAVTLLGVAAIVAIFSLGRRWASRGGVVAGSQEGAGAQRASGPEVSQAELDDLEDELDALDGI
jgi:cytochrome c-type biogenesis protein CcmH/NrfF